MDNIENFILQNAVGEAFTVYKGGVVFALKMPDDSMEPFISPNSLIIIDVEREPKDGEIVALNLDGQDLVRGYYDREETVLLVFQKLGIAPYLIPRTRIKKLFSVVEMSKSLLNEK